MEPFRLTRQSIAFMAMMAVVALVVAVAAPFGAIALGLLAILAIGMVLIKAMFRARRWWPMTEVEGTIVRLGDGWHRMVGWPSSYPGTRTGTVTRSVNYSDPAMQQRLKDALREAGIPFSVKMQDGKEFIGWAPEHNEAAQVVDARIKAGQCCPPAPGRLSTTIGWPSCFCRRSPTARESTSARPPGANGATMRTGRAG